MTKRLLDCDASDFITMSKYEILEAIEASEGRVIVSESIGAVQPLLYDVSNAELEAAFGSDILLLNMFDVAHPSYQGIPAVDGKNVIEVLKNLTGRLLGVNLEPVDERETHIGTIEAIEPGRRATVDMARKASELGFNMIVLTGNPKTNVSNKEIVASLKAIHKELGDRLILAAGKMHAAGSAKEAGANLVTAKDIQEFRTAGADIILLPSPGTVPGMSMEMVKGLVDEAHRLGALTMTTIGTSQEGADRQTIRQIALMNKMTGTDVHHLGDAGYNGVTVPENIMAYSMTIRGRRHTYMRMARSINR